MKVEFSSNGLVWEDKESRLVFKEHILGVFSSWAIRQSPYTYPRCLDIAIDELNNSLKGFDNLNMRKFTCSELRSELENIFEKSIVIIGWNTPKKPGWDGVSTRFSKPKPDYDFIDMDALARNISNSVWHEILYNDACDNNRVETSARAVN